MPVISKPMFFSFLALIAAIGVGIIMVVRNEAAVTRAEMAKVAQEAPKKAIKSLEDEAIDKAKEVGKTIFGGEKSNEAPEKAKKPESKGNIFIDVLDTINKTARTVDEKVQDFLGISSEDEENFGKQFHEFLASQIKLTQDKENLARVKRLAEPFLKLRSRKDINYTFSIVQSDEINAFAGPGGYIYFNQGLLKFMGQDSELQFVIGHEIAHVDLKHPIKSLGYALTAEKVAGTEAAELANLAYMVFSAGYKKEDEFAADLKSFIWLKELGLSRKDALAGPRKLVVLEKQIEGKEYPGKPKGNNKIIEVIDRHFRSHPPSEERVLQLENVKWP